jgi:malate synthase
MLESAITAIMDCEDSIAAVDAEDKVVVYRNWLGLMNGDLQEDVSKGGKTFTRKLNPDRELHRPRMAAADAARPLADAGAQCRSPDDQSGDPRQGRQRGAGRHHGCGMITGLIALHDVGPKGRRMNSRAGSMYVVKPKMHGPEEVAFASELFGRVEAGCSACSPTR